MMRLGSIPLGDSIKKLYFRRKPGMVIEMVRVMALTASVGSVMTLTTE
jgi:hypothetical protein